MKVIHDQDNIKLVIAHNVCEQCERQWFGTWFLMMEFRWTGGDEWLICQDCFCKHWAHWASSPK